MEMARAPMRAGIRTLDRVARVATWLVALVGSAALLASPRGHGGRELFFAVAVGSIAAGIATADPWRASWAAVKIGLAAFLVPFLLFNSPVLLGHAATEAMSSPGGSASRPRSLAAGGRRRRR